MRLFIVCIVDKYKIIYVIYYDNSLNFGIFFYCNKFYGVFELGKSIVFREERYRFC